jgi:hypothetical protein
MEMMISKRKKLESGASKTYSFYRFEVATEVLIQSNSVDYLDGDPFETSDMEYAYSVLDNLVKAGCTVTEHESQDGKQLVFRIEAVNTKFELNGSINAGSLKKLLEAPETELLLPADVGGGLKFGAALASVLS